MCVEGAETGRRVVQRPLFSLGVFTANAVPSRFGQIDLSGDPVAIFLKVFAGEVLTAFSETNVFLGRSMVRTIVSGKSAQFPASWKGTAGYHTPGVELVGTTVAQNERIIVIDDLLVADRFIALIDEAMTHFEIRSEYSRDIGRALARTLDKNLAQVFCLAARSASTVTGGPGGTVVTTASMDTDMAVLIAGVASAMQALDEKNVPAEDRTIFLSPSTFYKLINSDSKAINRDYNPDGVNGGVGSGQIFRLFGGEIVKTNNLPTTVVSTGPTAYQGDFTDTVAIVAHRSAVGTVKLIDLAVEMDYDIRRQGTLLVGKYALGHGILRPEAAVELVIP